MKIPAQSPNCNAYAERFVKSIKYECLNHFVFFGERHLRSRRGPILRDHFPDTTRDET